MRQTISGMVAAVAVMMTAGAAPAMACGGGLFQSSCSPCAYEAPCAPAPVYVAPVETYSGCNTGCGGWAHERLPDPVHQYYYVNQGPTYTGPGNWAPQPTYQESAVSGWGAYRHRPYYYGYDGGRYASPTNHYYDGAGIEGPRVYSYGYRARPHYGYRYSVRPSVRYGYAPRHSYAPRYGYSPRYGMAPRHSMRYGAPMMMMPRHYGHRERVLRRYY
jgi:hypothetical protein